MTTQTQERTLTYTCPHCGAPVEVEASADGSLVNCPAASCGKPFRVEVPVAKAAATPSALVLPPGVGRPAEAAIPVLPDALAAPQTIPPTPAQEAQAKQAVAAAKQAQAPSVPETAPSTIHLSLFRRYPFRCLGYFLLAAVGLALLIFCEMQNWHWVSLLCGVVTAAVLLRLFVWWVRMRFTVLLLTNKRCTLRMGVFSRESTEFEFAQLTDFHVSQTMLMRWLDVGDLAIVGNNGQKIVIMAVPHPASVLAHLQMHVEVEKKAAEQPDMVVVQQPVSPNGTPAATV